MNNEIKTEEIKKTKVFSKWVVFHSLSSIIAFFYYAYLDPFNEEILYSDSRGAGRVAGALGVFIFTMIIPWIIALVNRIWKKKSSNTGLFIVYYVILFLLTFYYVTWGMMLHRSLNLSIWSNFEDSNRFAVFITPVFFLIIFYLFRFLIIKVIRWASS